MRVKSTACGWCGVDPAEGFAMVSADGKDTRYCHDGPSPTCYENVIGELADGMKGGFERLLALMPD